MKFSYTNLDTIHATLVHNYMCRIVLNRPFHMSYTKKICNVYAITSVHRIMHDFFQNIFIAHDEAFGGVPFSNAS